MKALCLNDGKEYIVELHANFPEFASINILESSLQQNLIAKAYFINNIHTSSENHQEEVHLLHDRILLEEGFFFH